MIPQPDHPRTRRTHPADLASAKVHWPLVATHNDQCHERTTQLRVANRCRSCHKMTGLLGIVTSLHFWVCLKNQVLYNGHLGLYTIVHHFQTQWVLSWPFTGLFASVNTCSIHTLCLSTCSARSARYVTPLQATLLGHWTVCIFVASLRFF